MNTVTVVLVLLVLAVIVAAVVKKKSTEATNQKGRFESRPPLTRKEQTMYWHLAMAFSPPEYAVFAQVSFDALLVAKGGASRSTLAHKRANFVLLDKAFLVLAIIELDDGSHDAKAERGGARDTVLKSAGYKVLRYRKVPDVERIKSDLTKQVFARQAVQPR